MISRFIAAALVAAGTIGAAGAPYAADAIDGLFDVGDHRLYMHCVGTGAPTIVYFHGYSWDVDDASSGRAWHNVPEIIVAELKALIGSLLPGAF